jgi:hypothetical protein
MVNSASHLNNSIHRRCLCLDCKEGADVFLKIVRAPEEGYYCVHCASDLKWHGIAEEEVNQ